MPRSKPWAGGRIKPTVSDAADAIAEVAQTVVETAGDTVTDVVETAGNAAQDGLATVGGPGGKWLGGVIAGVANVIGAVIKGAFGIVSGVVGGAIRIIGGLLSLDGALIFKGLLDIFSGIGGALIYLLGTIVSLFQRIFFLQNNERPLIKEERDILRRVFLNSISLYDIRIIEGKSSLFGMHPGATTLGNSIYMNNIDLTTPLGLSGLVHECVHVWQYQNLGSRYTADALGAQAFLPDGYNWENSEINRGNTDWKDFNKEGQAEFMQDLWRRGSLTYNGHTETGRGCFFDLQAIEASFGNGTAEFIYRGTDDSDIPTELHCPGDRSRDLLAWTRQYPVVACLLKAQTGSPGV